MVFCFSWPSTSPATEHPLRVVILPCLVFSVSKASLYLIHHYHCLSCRTLHLLCFPLALFFIYGDPLLSNLPPSPIIVLTHLLITPSCPRDNLTHPFLMTASQRNLATMPLPTLTYTCPFVWSSTTGHEYNITQHVKLGCLTMSCMSRIEPKHCTSNSYMCHASMVGMTSTST